jgi:GntR family transcriptional regulator
MATVPRYLQIADDLRQRIESGEFAPNAPVPTEGELGDEYDASRNTIREAVRVLVQQRRLETRQGQGTFVPAKIVAFVTRLSTAPEKGEGTALEEGTTHPPSVREQQRLSWTNPLEVGVLRCPARIAARLGIEEGERVVSRYQERSIDKILWSCQTTYYPYAWVTRGAEALLIPDGIEAGAMEYLANAIGLKQVGYRDHISARLANDREQKLFQLAHNQTVIEIYRTSFAADETPLRVTVTVFPSDRNQIMYDIGCVPDHFDDPV